MKSILGLSFFQQQSWKSAYLSVWHAHLATAAFLDLLHVQPCLLVFSSLSNVLQKGLENTVTNGTADFITFSFKRAIRCDRDSTTTLNRAFSVSDTHLWLTRESITDNFHLNDHRRLGEYFLATKNQSKSNSGNSRFMLSTKPNFRQNRHTITVVMYAQRVRHSHASRSYIVRHLTTSIR